ncbi:MAG: Methyl-accepting chemotaxis protein McpS [Syntrophorhabdaceae bacterium PtaU1.Bin034]|nr:MAG: Methyl-accepting chemotaxis protein McpS [Syntrophorhabdaceae bacterium PtaU1.Bin034]
MIFKNIGISKRLAIGFGILGFLMVVLVITGIISTSMINSRLEQITQVNTAKIQAAYEMKDGIKTVNLMAFGTLLSKDEAFLSKAGQIIATTKDRPGKCLESLEKLEASVKGKELLNPFRENFARGETGFDNVLKAAQAGKTDEAVSLFVGTILPAALDLFQMTDRLIQFQQDDIAVRTAEARRTFRQTMTFLIAMGIIILGIAVVLTFSLGRSLTIPIRKTVAATEMLAAGKLGIDITVDRKDEFGDQATALKAMVEKWREIVGSIKQASDDVASASVELSASAEHMQRGSGEQAERAHQVATASEEMSQTVLDISKNASSIATTATNAAKTAKDGGRIVEEAVKEVREIAETVGESEGHITSLAELSQRIGEIIGIINDIADQTNLLALNAAIEAARAGEHGRGFAVVADEVRKLAERTTGATSEVSGIIREIQSKVTSAVSSIERVSTKVDRGVDLSQKAGNELTTIVSNVEDLHIMVQQIATAIEEMSVTSDQISKDIESISGISSETSMASQEVTKASQELARLGTDLQGISKLFEL